MTGPNAAARRRVGRTTLELPVLGLGTAPLGELWAPIEEGDARATLEAAWEAGVRYYDTAPWYGLGLAEHRTGGFLRTRPRDAFAITTKVGRTLHRPPDPARHDRGLWTGGLNFAVRFDYGYDGIMASYEQALQRLSLDTVDALVIHDLDAGYHPDPDDLAGHRRDLRDGGMRALAELKESGQIRAVGMGINSDDAFESAAPDMALDFLVVAMPYTLLDQGSLHGGMASCQERGMSVVVGSPFASGILATGSGAQGRYGYAEAPEPVRERVRGLERVAQAHGVALQAAALQFPLAHPAVAAIIPGAVHAREAAANAASLEVAIPAAFWSDLAAEGLIDADAPVPPGD